VFSLSFFYLHVRVLGDYSLVLLFSGAEIPTSSIRVFWIWWGV